MRILRNTRDLPAEARGAVVALGNFDGVHRGHQALIGKARGLADDAGAKLVAVVFEPYPREFFRPDAEPFRLTPFRAKSRLLDALGVDFLIELHFDAAMAATQAPDFVAEVLVKELAVSHVVVGEDFRFGKGRSGDAVTLAYMGEMEGFGVTVFAPLAAGSDRKISSSRIRAALREGHPDEAARLLGHWWSVEGVVVPGDKRGRSIGIPTANLHVKGTLVPAFGVYAVRVHIGAEAKIYDGVANFGLRPTFAVSEPLLEAHLFDFTGEFYGEWVRVELIAYLRPERKFESLEALKAQIAVDSRAAGVALAKAG